MKLKTLIIDDEPLAHEVILKYLEDVPFIEVIGQCYLATEALSYLNSHTVDLLFLDINMPKLKGIDFLKILSQKPQVIITSAYQEYALESFELDVCDYLLKPFRFDRFLKAANKAQENYKLIHHQSEQAITNNIEQHSHSTSIFIKVDRKLIQIELNDIAYFEAYGNYVKVWLGDKSYLTPRTLSSFEEQLSVNDFVRVHKSFIIQKAHIDFIEATSIYMNNGNTLPLGKSFKHIPKQLK
jgi:two-component system, LytTR family, response regulator